jgi:cyclic pyranopterin phosphate synthase
MLRHEDILTLEEQVRMAQVAVKLGVDKIRLTGGEPLLRKGIATLLKDMDRLTPRPDLRITTNGLLLERHIDLLESCRVSTLNISLDTLAPEKYGNITGVGQPAGERLFAKVKKGIDLALESGAFQVKINVVALSGINHEEILDFARLTLKAPLAVRFIEYMPVGRHKPFQPRHFLSTEDILATLADLGPFEELPTGPGDGPARRFKVPGSPGELGVISALSSHFCAACNRLRLTADGRLAPCLFSEKTVDVKKLLRANATDEDLAQALLLAAREKPAKHQQMANQTLAAGCPMSRLGG